ncbi:MAG: GGDEF domain-containing protein [Leptospirales bacterium]|nr:GGDEF domain-containing protein [Leptospirales bacterium]
MRNNAGYELMKTVELERYKLESSIKSDIAIVLKMATSPIIQRYFLNPNNIEAKKIALEEINGYRRIFTSGLLFWVNDADKKFYLNGDYAYTVDPNDRANYWYSTTLTKTEKYNLNINYNPYIDMADLWINAPVFDGNHKSIGILGTGINLPNFINAIYQSYSETAELYFFNAAGEITGARDIDLIVNKVNINKELGQTGEEILARINNLKTGEIEYFETKNMKGVTALGSIPTLDWYVIAVLRFTVRDSLRTGMTVLFAVMMTVILLVFVVFNIFVVLLLEPLNRIVKKMIQISSDWDIEPQEEIRHKDEIGTLGEFFNMTIIDPLTGIYNRRFFDGSLKQIIKSFSRKGSKLSLLLVDVDFFKKYNDTYGHDMGDSCLKRVASSLVQCITREEDFAARYGGEEFVVVLPNTDENGAYLIANKLLKKIRECNIPHEKSNAADFVTISIGGTTGIVKHSQHGSDYIKSADIALYKSKQNGRNQYTFENFDESAKTDE